MADKRPNPRAMELVLARYPTAWVDDDGERVAIRYMRTLTTPCRECGKSWTRTEKLLTDPIIGNGGTDGWAWHNAAVSLKLNQR